ncbi:unnamed protein product [Phytophthora lilii]|uniref:RxLR effector protein n=1 Tax=Phytophthora lilii TaxID=2077276 RepID=A0A9W6T9U3_9STRA|nr:unnamed protein product [Phytophthora lilii]
MRVLSYLVAIVLASSCAAPAVALISDKTNLSKFNSGIEIFSQTVSGDQTKRYLRSYDNADDEYEERAGLNNLDELLSKLKITGRASTSGMTKVDDIISRFDDIAQKYPRGLSSSTKNQLVQVEKQRARDVYELVTMNKKKPDGMQRYIEPFPGMKVDPGFSHVGREQQRYEGGKRLLSCSVISRPEREGGGDVLLISSSNPNKHEWLLPKGGWDYGEDLHTSAYREAREEGGVRCSFCLNDF